MTRQTRTLLFTLFAPVTIPAYALLLAASNLLGVAFYITIEATLAPILRRPVALTRSQTALLAVPVLLLAPIAAAGHVLIWLVRLIGRFLVLLGRWQTGLERRWAAFIVGFVWLVAALWIVVACFDAQRGSRLIGRPAIDSDRYIEFITRFKSLAEMPEPMQVRRAKIIEELKTRQEAADPNWQDVLDWLSNDDASFRVLARRRPFLGHRLAGIPWFFEPGELSEDGLDHSVILFGPLFLAIMLMVRWPGTFRAIRPPGLRLAWGLARILGATWAIHAIITWSPATTIGSFEFRDGMPGWFVAISPALWLGVSQIHWMRLEWWLFNAGLWLALAGLAAWIWWLAWSIGPHVGWPRHYIAFLSSRLLQRKRIAFFSVGAVTLCVAMMIIVISVMGGFVDSIRDKAHGLLGDLVMDGGLQGFPFYQEFIDHLSVLRQPDGTQTIQKATPLIHSFGLLQFPSDKRTRAVSIWGIRLDEYVRVNRFGDDLFYDRRYGGTTLASQKQPVYGFNDQGIAILPPEMEKHFSEYLAGLPLKERTQLQKRFPREVAYGYRGPGIFDGGEGEIPKPGYEGKPYPGVIIGRDVIAIRLASGEYLRNPKYPKGAPCVLTLLPLTRGGDVAAEPPPKPAFRYADDSRTGIHDIDSEHVYVDFEVLQHLMSMDAQQRAGDAGETAPRCSQIQIKVASSLAPRDRLRKVKAEIEQAWKDFAAEKSETADPLEQQLMENVDTETWEEMQRDYISAVEKEKFLVLIMFGVISIVAVFLILCIFWMIVQEKTRDIGILKSVGASAAGVTAVFLAYGAAIGIVGAVLGSLIGTTFVEHINEIQDGLARINPEWRVWSPTHYSFDKIPDVWKWSEVIWISILSIGAAMLGAAFPATRAGRTWPVESLRYE